MNELSLSLALVEGCSSRLLDLHRHLPVGHRLSPARLRHLGASTWLVASNAAVPVAFAAYKRADGEIRVVHEWLLDPALTHSEAMSVTDTLLSAIEFTAGEDGVTCVTFLLPNEVAIEPFEQRGYVSLVLGGAGVWLQRKLGWCAWHGGSLQCH